MRCCYPYVISSRGAILWSNHSNISTSRDYREIRLEILLLAQRDEIGAKNCDIIITEPVKYIQQDPNDTRWPLDGQGSLDAKLKTIQIFDTCHVRLHAQTRHQTAFLYLNIMVSTKDRFHNKEAKAFFKTSRNQQRARKLTPLNYPSLNAHLQLG